MSDRKALLGKLRRPLGPMAKEHVKLVKVLESPSRSDDVKEAKKQKKELAEYVESGK